MPRLIIFAAMITPLILGGCMAKDAPNSASSNDTEAAAPSESGAGMTSESQTIAPTLIGHRPTFEKILGNSGISLQWISWEAENRGQLEARMKDGTLYLKGGQAKATGFGSLSIDGRVISVTENAFTFNGTISITDTPDAGRNCRKKGMSKFAITQGRKYFRMREFEWCDGLTDYIDIYF